VIKLCLCASKSKSDLPPKDKNRNQIGNRRRGTGLGKQQGPDGAKVSLMLEEERFECVLRPVVHGEGQQLHRDGIDAQKVAHEHDLKWEEGESH
jgi:hypothetical protein